MKTPFALLKLKARMVLAGLTLRVVAEEAEVEYIRASEVLSGSRNDPKSLERLSRVIMAAKVEGGVAV